jgi:hypothetical protein
MVRPPPLGVCQVAAVPDVAVSVCPVVGAVAAATFTTVVAEFSALAVAAASAVSARVFSTPVALSA